MGPIRSIARCYLGYFQFCGRASRREFNWFMGFVVLVVASGFLALDVADTRQMAAWDRYYQLTEEEQRAFNPISPYSNWPRPGIAYLVVGLTLVPSYAVGTRRAHDVGFEGFQAFLCITSPFGFWLLVRVDGEPYENDHGFPPPGTADRT